MTTQATTGLELSEAAVAKATALRDGQEVEGLKLRVAVKSGGCSGFQYDLYFDTEAADDDVIRSYGELDVVIDSDSWKMLEGARLDFTDGLSGAGFAISNPNAERTCGCGKSFC
jgi:iron-sulfur cluster assembly accessory protein